MSIKIQRSSQRAIPSSFIVILDYALYTRSFALCAFLLIWGYDTLSKLVMNLREAGYNKLEYADLDMMRMLLMPGVATFVTL